MTFTENEITEIKSSWELVSHIDQDVIAKLFYGKLFETAPSVQPLFPNDMKSQGRKLMKIINTAVKSIDNLEAIQDVVSRLGDRHLDYGAEVAHYPVVGETLIWTLEQGLGDKFTPEIKKSWVKLYSLLSKIMISRHQLISV